MGRRKIPDDLADLISQLLDKEGDRELQYDLYGYPDDFLSVPAERSLNDYAATSRLIRVLKSLYKEAEDAVVVNISTKEYFRLIEGEYAVPMTRMIDGGISKYTVSTKFLRQLLTKATSIDKLFPCDGGFYVRVKRKLLHDNAVSVIESI